GPGTPTLRLRHDGEKRLPCRRVEPSMPTEDGIGCVDEGLGLALQPLVDLIIDTDGRHDHGFSFLIIRCDNVTIIVTYGESRSQQCDDRSLASCRPATPRYE